MPEVPTIAEAGTRLGLARFDIDTWFGLFGPARLPAETTAAPQQGLRRRPRLERLKRACRASPPSRCRCRPSASAAFVQAELAKYEPLVKRSGARVE
jgi:tripartite-type tricarboxylate transporter receptor subunit TctC